MSLCTHTLYCPPRPPSPPANPNPPLFRQVAVQAIDGVRTVASFNLTRKVMAMYNRELNGVLKEGLKRGVTDGLALGLSQLISLGAYGFVFW